MWRQVRLTETGNSLYLGVCLKTQGFPDAINHPDFPSIILERDDLYHSTTKFRFLLEK
nr:hypothetical protein [Peribacillus alkalitolerans]